MITGKPLASRPWAADSGTAELQLGISPTGQLLKSQTVISSANSRRDTANNVPFLNSKAIHPFWPFVRWVNLSRMACTFGNTAESDRNNAER